MHSTILSFKNDVDVFSTVEEAHADLAKHIKAIITEQLGEELAEITDAQPRVATYDFVTKVLLITLTINDERAVVPTHTAGMYVLENGAGNWIPVNL